jgi:O-succinylbenzoic acid--CoA ligase
MRNSARMTNAFFGLNETSTALLCLPASYIAGKMMVVRAIEGKFNLITVEPKANPFENLQQAIDFTAITPYQLQHSLEEINKLEIKKIIVGGAKINSDSEAAIKQLCSAVYETYGMTETCSHIALRAVNGNNKSDYFKVLSGISIRKNENDCLCINAPHLLSDEITTNDIVELIDSERFLIKGRFDNIINSGGVKLNPEQIEQKLETLISVPFFISSKPDSALGNKVILVIQSSPFTSESEAKLMQALDVTLEKYERPKEIVYIPQFSYSVSNKLLKAETLRNI